jgi:hypothetical protein
MASVSEKTKYAGWLEDEEERISRDDQHLFSPLSHLPTTQTLSWGTRLGKSPRAGEEEYIRKLAEGQRQALPRRRVDYASYAMFV